MKIEDLKYTLGGAHIVAEPREVRLGKRDLGRMIVVDRSRKKQIDSFVRNLPDYFEGGDVLVLNNSKRVPGILKGYISENSAQVELLFVNLGKNDSAMCRIYPRHYIKVGTEIRVGADNVKVVDEGLTINNLFEVTALSDSLANILKKNGVAINAFFSSKEWTVDHLNPFYSNREGSVESPLAGLHFTPELLNTLADKGVNICYITLHSSGSWLPFLEEDIDDHKVFEEEYEVQETTASIINEAKSKGNKVVACGSTAMRTIETTADDNGIVHAQQGVSQLYIKPGYKFRVVDHYFTNFHQYRTSLMVLDAAFCGKDLLLESIEVAKQRGYLFYEFGDAVFYL